MFTGYYHHSNENIRHKQALRRDTARDAIAAGAIEWSTTVGLTGGFIHASGRKLELESAIALWELRLGGELRVSEQLGTVRLAFERERSRTKAS